jgi:glycosyltransferase involved in cell wall biosynthesis
MDVLFLSASLSRNAGGICEIEKSLAHALSHNAVEVHALGLYDSHWEQDMAGWVPLKTTVVPVFGPRSFGYAPALKRQLAKASFDLLHLHAMWMYPSLLAHWAKKVRKCPLMVTPNGMLEPWALSNSAWKKKFAGFLYEDRMLHGATCLQANTEKELRDFRAYGLVNPVCIIPNGVDLPEVRNNMSVDSHEKKTLLFLGRLHPKKGLPNALRAWSTICRGNQGREWQLVIAGWDQGGHEAELKQICLELGLPYADATAGKLWDSVTGSETRKPVVFTGPAFGDTKDRLFRMADAFILPSFSEGLPMAVLEAWGHGLPVVMTDHCNLPEGFAEQAAWRTDTSTEGIAETLQLLLAAPDADRIAKGLNGRKLVQDRFSWPMVASQMKQVYDWLLGGGAPPPSVRLL